MYKFTNEELLSLLNEFAEVHGYSYIYTIDERPNGRALNVYFYGSTAFLAKDVIVFYDKSTTLAQIKLAL